ncbi:DUF4424 family protein [Legionella cardiaca]|uniref:DUF4424 family protein n=1 Tax=Legionella cardiaca TaxID=1071983 RepID=A0ABY8AQB6_9GAMM|nr:DUF4424 family protein [Legionella cardiaca]WED42840.1 DUF4424 family protein [Legionella cardiaca]
MNYSLKKFVIAGLLLSIANISFANDSSAELAAGGLVFVKNPQIEMRSEELYLSLKKVRVRYVFFNKSSKDLSSVIAFPLPNVESYYHSEKALSIFPVDDPLNPVGFITRVNGQTVKMHIEQKAIVKGKDQTALLKKYNIPLFPQYRKISESLSKIPKKDWPELQKLGVIWIEEFDDGTGMKKVPQPAWTLKSVYYWQQKFPAGKELIIEHQYQPIVGYTPETRIAASYAIHEAWYPAYLQKFCIDEKLQKDVANKIKNGMSPYNENRLSYILKTGANWSGPIGDFKLVIDKGQPKNLVSFCGTNVKKISPTEFAIHKKNFIPNKNLHLLFLVPNKLTSKK